MENKIITFKLSKELEQKLERAYKSKNINCSEYIRDILEKNLTNEKNIIYLQDSLNYLALNVEKTSVEANNLIETEIKKKEKEIVELRKRLEDIEERKRKALQEIKSTEETLKKYINFDNFLEKLKNMNDDELSALKKEIIDQLPKHTVPYSMGFRQAPIITESTIKNFIVEKKKEIQKS